MFSYMVEQIPKYSCGTIVSLELTYNGVAIYVCMHGVTEEKNPVIHAYTSICIIKVVMFSWVTCEVCM